MEKLEKLKKDILERKRKIWIELRDEYFGKLGKDYSDQFTTPQDMEDLSIVDLIEDTGITVANIRKDELTAMEETLRKIDEGTYGVCDECGAKIDEGRLKALPYAIYCVGCQKKRER